MDAHRWGLVSDEDDDEHEVCRLCGAQRNRHGRLAEKATISGGWPNVHDCDAQEAVLVAADRLAEAYAAMLEGRDVGYLPEWQQREDAPC
jgi:hypothetical protein